MPSRKKTQDESGSLFAYEAPTEQDLEAVAEKPPSPSAAEVAPRGLPSSWMAALGEQFKQPYFTELHQFISAERKQHQILPPGPDVFNAYRMTPLHLVRVVILGQDPYPTPGHAHGLCFSVRHGVSIPASLRNIYKELQADLGVPPASHGNLEAWAKQGIFLLNTVLTVRSGLPNSHKNKGWEKFTDATIAAVNALDRPVVFLLWGAQAKQKAKLLDATRHAIIQGVHPSPMSADSGFFGSKPFSKVNEALVASGQSPIDWQLPQSNRN
jgi:uracil-DNA glycosylase